MTRFAAFVCFVAAAFAWVPPLIDRPGLAALGLGFTALALGKVKLQAGGSWRDRLAQLVAPPVPPLPTTAYPLDPHAAAVAPRAPFPWPDEGSGNGSGIEDGAEILDEI